jgi:hypothetical protein
MSELAPCTKLLINRKDAQLTEGQKEYLAAHDLGAVFSCDRSTGEEATVPCVALISSFGGVAAKSCLVETNQYARQEEIAQSRLTPNEVLRRVMSREGYKSVKPRPY